ncbi:uncharacterized protein LOC114332924 [Diabrotica virgifera virgifera]|uniref:Uncharacterized protein LOC114332924 n=1 Tax=Diabrotica virgifera virgifera TaxID=50390 RepID=A0A6P7G1K1_DIAVI|nr:uncharacterized protein LOC114332924 [Diabrotica virgifera virgifera]
MSVNSAHDIFEIKPLVENINIKLCARRENGVKQLLALLTSEGDVVLYYTYGELTPVLRRIPWFNDSFKQIEALCFDPSATWLLVVSLDCSLYIIPALSLVDKKQKIDCKWSLTDITHFPRPLQIPDSKPTSAIWWQTLDCNQNALVGFENGIIVLISLTDGRCLGSCTIGEIVDSLNICHDNNLEIISLLINGASGQQWRLVLEQHSTGYLWPPEAYTQTEDSTRSRLYSLKQLGVDKLASLRQRLTEARGSRRDSNSDSASESSHTESVNSNTSGPELLPHLCDTHFAPQYARNRYLFTAFYKPTSLLTVHSVDVESAPLYVHKLPQKTSTVLLTDKLIYTVSEESKMVSIMSSHLSECRLEGEAEFNSDAMIAQFYIENGKILRLFKLVDLSSVRLKKRDDNKKDKVYELPKTVDDLHLQKPRIDTCIIVTDSCIYKIGVCCSPIKKFVQYVTEENDLERAEQLSRIFGLNIQQLLECCGDLLISRGSFHSGIILYKQAKVHLLKRVLKLAISADCKTLLKFVHLCLSASKVDMSVATKIHIGNLAVMAYTELILRYGGHQRISNTKDFMNFLSFEEYYDQILAVNVACQAGHWNVVALLAKSRGLQPEVVTALGQILQSARAPKPSERDFLYALSEPCLTQSLLIFGQCSQYIFQYVRTNIEHFPLDILRRLAIQLDPSQPSAIPLVSRLFQTTKFSSSLETTIECIDFENPDRTIVTVKDLIDTFLIIIIHLIWKTENIGFELSLLENVQPPDIPPPVIPLKNLPDFHPLSCGFEHAAIIRNNNVYTMGVANSGCLGLGPLLTQSSPARLVQTLSELKVRVLSVSCGKKHTLALTDFGVYSWGSNTYGQLGLGHSVQESPYPQMINCLSSQKIIDLCAGQYHSVAVTADGKVYTWGWGIHGQLGHGNCDNEFHPKLLDFPENVKQVTAGHAHTLILTVDGKLFGFGSNVFGQLEGSNIEESKSVKPVWVLVPTDNHTPIEKVASAYFHNIAVLKDQEVHTWGASPQEVRILQSKNNQKQNCVSSKPSESWKASTHIYSGFNKKPIEQVAVGYRHSVVLHNGKILWGKNREEELCVPKLKQQDGVSSLFAQRFVHVSCGLEYTMAIDHAGKLLAWGSPSMAQTILGKPMDDDNRKVESRVIFFKNTKRIIKFPNQGQSSTDCLPIEVPGLPTLAITYNPSDHKLLFSKNFAPYAICNIENNEVPIEQNHASSLDSIYESPNLKIGYKTLHYVLETYHGFYDTDNVLSKCLEVHNYQAAAKIAMLDGHFGDSLGFQLIAFKKYLESLDLDMTFSYAKRNSDSKDYIELIVRNIQDDLNEKNLVYSSTSPAHILSTSSSLDSIRQWGDDLEHQGGRESPCEVPEVGDIRQNISQYVQSLTNNESSPPISSVSKMVSEIDNVQIKMKQADVELQIKDKKVKEIIDAASYVVEFYIRKVYVSENHILMQNILLKCIEFWLSSNLPVPVLENILLKNMDKYFYPLSILLFCKNFCNPEEDDVKPTSSGFLKEFSTKFCLQLCSMVLENVDKA